MTSASAPRAQLLSNGSYSVMITDAGSGYSRWRDLAITRWRADPTCDADGAFIFLRDVVAGDVWSVGAQPIGIASDDYAITVSEDRVEIIRRHASILSRLEVIVAPEDDVELRRVTLTNTGAVTREIELTSYAEVVLGPPAADAAHLAFSKLMVRTECIPARSTLVAMRRPKSPDESWPWMAHAIAIEGDGRVAAVHREIVEAHLRRRSEERDLLVLVRADGAPELEGHRPVGRAAEGHVRELPAVLGAGRGRLLGCGDAVSFERPRQRDRWCQATEGSDGEKERGANRACGHRGPRR